MVQCDFCPKNAEQANVSVYTIGDADHPGRIINALFQAYCLAREF